MYVVRMWVEDVGGFTTIRKEKKVFKSWQKLFYLVNKHLISDCKSLIVQADAH